MPSERERRREATTQSEGSGHRISASSSAMSEAAMHPADVLHRRALGQGGAEAQDGEAAAQPYLHLHASALPRAMGQALESVEVIEATGAMLAPRTWEGKVYTQLKRVLLGRPLSTEEQLLERVGKAKALAVFSSDAISSVAYATEASLGVLITAGAAALSFNLGIALSITILMLIVGSSYQQTIHAYPQGGGSYIVARDNLGDLPGLVAAAALLVDYVLTVSVSVSSGVDALASAFPTVHPFSVALGVLFIGLIMLGNLRGLRESGSIFALPTYLFIGAFLVMIAAGVVRAATGPGGLLGAAPAVATPERLGWGTQRLTVLLVLTAFASGCSAMTGVEAISNGVSAFRAPQAKNAAQTLVWMVGTLMTLFVGITYLTWRFGIEPSAHQNPTVDAQIAALVFTGPFRWLFYLVQFATLLILVLAANTSFAGFPRLSSILANDHFLTHQFAFRGDRLAFSTGILVLGVLSATLLALFGGNTDALINLYALGVFTAFTLSQSGMVIRWWRRRKRAGHNWQLSLAINFVGALATGIVATVIMIAKFERGAWIIVLLIPVLILAFLGVSRHYAFVRQRIEALPAPTRSHLQHLAIVPIARMNSLAVHSLAYARSLTPHVIALHVSMDQPDEEESREAWTNWAKWLDTEWERRHGWYSGGMATGKHDVASEAEARLEGRSGPRLVILESPYRSLIPPILAYVDAMRDTHPGMTLTVILPEFVPAHWWEYLLHNRTALRLKIALYVHHDVVVANIPYHLGR